MSNTHRSFLTILCGILIIISCNNYNQQAGKLLMDAQQLMDSHPDSALIILDTNIDNQKLTTKQYALWCLLLTKAKDKNYIQHTSDSLINIAMTHYEKTNETELLMEAYYYMGRANDDLKETLKAQDYYLKALEAGKDSDNRKLLTRIYYNVGSLYLYQDVHEQAIKYLKEALKYTDSEKDSTAQSYVLRDIARCFSTQNNQDSALVYYTEALKYSDSADEIYILNELGSTYRKMKDYQKSYLYLQKAKQIIPETDKEKFRHIYLNVGLVHLETNHFDSATIYMEEAAKSRYMPTKASAQHFLYKLAKLQGNTEKALLYIEYAKLLNDSIYQDNKSNSLRKAQAIYDYNQAKNAINKLKLAHISSESSRYRAWAIAGTATLAFIILITVSIFLFKYLKKRNTDLKSQLVDFKQNSDTALKNNMARIGELEAIIAKSSNEIEQIVKENETLKTEQEKRKASAGILENSSVYKKYYLAIQIIKKSKHDTYADIGITSEDKEELKELIESLYPHFALRIMQYYPSISEVELHLCYLCKIGITSPSILSHFLNITNQAVTMKRNRLHIKLLKEKGNKESFEKFINSL